MSRYTGKVTRPERAVGEFLVEATVAYPVSVAALARAARLAVNQNMDVSQPRAGILLSGEDAPGGRTTVRMLITDETASAKALRGIYPAVVIAVEDGELGEISLVHSRRNLFQRVRLPK
jgi:hypothetical protein